ncbi:MAG: carboxylesterase/lipase family protein [Congregibacter sp.]
MDELSRRQFLAASAAGAAAAMLSGCAVSGDKGGTIRNVIAQTREGPVLGVSLGESVRFLGVPFAAAPVGPLRFKAPQAAAKREGVFSAMSFAPAPIQNAPREGLYGPGILPLSEDCLAVNIWRPHSDGPNPVYVWIHGGGNVAGSSRMPVFDGAQFARDGIVCVTLSYRVGCFGFLDVSPILGSDYAGSGNNGMLDIVAALEWVRDNIAEFGGDPLAITVGGQSAGAKNVCTLLGMPAAKNLFRAAIVESGGAETINTPEAAIEMANLFADEAGGDEAVLGQMPARELLAIQNRVSSRWPRKYPFRPVIDGIHLLELPLFALHSGRASRIPLLIGTTRDEIAFFGPNARRDGTVVQGDLANMSLSAFSAVYADYPKVFPDACATDLRYAALTAEEYGIPTINAADAHGGKAPTWRYRFDMPRSTAPNADYAVHGSELALVWNKLDDPGSALLGPEGSEADMLSTRMHAHWVSFIQNGRPDAAIDPDWDAYEASARTTLLFDTQSRVVGDPEGAERKLWSSAKFDFSQSRNWEEASA